MSPRVSTSAKMVMFLLQFVCLFVCLSEGLLKSYIFICYTEAAIHDTYGNIENTKIQRSLKLKILVSLNEFS